MLTRIKQFLAAITAKIDEQDIRFVSAMLNKTEQKLFWNMNVPDQRHALNVTYTALELADELPEVNKELLVKSALLHDVGKVRGDVSTIDKTIAVVADKFVPSFAKRVAKFGKGNVVDNLRHALYIYYHHSQRGALMLAEIGADADLVELVAKHHKAPADSDPPELTILQAADNMH